MQKKRLLTALLAVALILSMGAFAMAQTDGAADNDNGNGGNDQTPTFSDVPNDHPAITEIEFCALNKFVLGYENGTFNPDGNISREHFVTVWARTFHARMHNFSDATKTKDEIDNAIVLMYGLGFINGVSSTEFSRGGNITREQVAQIVKNTYLPGVDGHDMYTDYDDGASVSDWARDAVSVCREKGIFSGITADNKFEPGKAITRAEVCVVIYNLMEVYPVKYSINVASMDDGTVTPNKSTAAAGESVKLVVVPDPGKRLVADSLKYNDTVITGTSFIMPAENVTITAQFEDIPTLTGITIKTEPKTDYTVGETLNTTGLVITATYSDMSTKDISAGSTGLTTTPAAGDTLDTEGTESVTVSYTEDTITETADYNIIVSAAGTGA